MFQGTGKMRVPKCTVSRVLHACVLLVMVKETLPNTPCLTIPYDQRRQGKVRRNTVLHVKKGTTWNIPGKKEEEKSVRTVTKTVTVATVIKDTKVFIATSSFMVMAWWCTEREYFFMLLLCTFSEILVRDYQVTVRGEETWFGSVRRGGGFLGERGRGGERVERGGREEGVRSERVWEVGSEVEKHWVSELVSEWGREGRGAGGEGRGKIICMFLPKCIFDDTDLSVRPLPFIFIFLFLLRLFLLLFLLYSTY